MPSPEQGFVLSCCVHASRGGGGREGAMKLASSYSAFDLSRTSIGRGRRNADKFLNIPAFFPLLSP